MRATVDTLFSFSGKALRNSGHSLYLSLRAVVGAHPSEGSHGSAGACLTQKSVSLKAIRKSVCSLVFTFCAFSAAQASDGTIQIGYATSLDPALYIEAMVPLVQKIQETIPGVEVHTRELNFSGRTPDLANVDFLLISGAETRMVGTDNPLVLATLGKSGADRSQSVGSVFVVNSSSAYRTLSDLRGRRVAANDANSFDGWIIAMNELAEEGFEWKNFFAQTYYTHWQFPDVLTLLSAGQVEVGILPTCALEKALAQGALQPGAVRVIHEKTLAPDECRRSTELFPGIQLVAMPHVPAGRVKAVLQAAYAIPAQPDGVEWLPNTDTAGIDRLLENLHLGPFAYLDRLSWQTIWTRYRFWILLGLGVIAFLMLDVVRINRIVKKKTAQLEAESEARQEANRALEASQHRLDLLERASMVSQLSAMIAHDLKQPLTIIVNYLNGLVLFLEQGNENRELLKGTLRKVVGEAYRLSDIIERVRQVNRRDWAAREKLNLREVLGRVLEYAQLDAERMGLSEEVFVMGNALEIELAVLNIVRNAKSAVKVLGREGAVRVSLTSDGDFARIKVEDNGPAISDAVFQNLGRVTRSSKPDGMGYGLAIAHSIVEAHQGHLNFSRLEPQGLSVEIVLPVLDRVVCEESV